MTHPTIVQVRSRNPRGQGERLRDEILDAADSLLATTGDATALSLRRIAKQVGIAATSVYLHFPDVADLKIAVVKRGFARLDVARDGASNAIADPVEALLARLAAYTHFALDNPGRYRLMFGPELPATLAYDAEQSPSRHALESLVHSLTRCQEAGVALSGDDLHQVAIMVWAAMHGMVLLRMDRPSFPWPSLNEMINEMVLRLIRYDTCQ